MYPTRRFFFFFAAALTAVFMTWAGTVSSQSAETTMPSETSNFAFPYVAGEALFLSPEGKVALRKVEDQQIKELRDLEDKYYGDLRALREKHHRERTEVKKQYGR